MHPVSAKWAPALTTDHGLAVKVDVLYGGAIVAEDIAFTDGSVHVDAGSDVRRTLSLSIPDPSDFPRSETARFGVYGQEIHVQAGITYPDGTTELVSLGYFAVSSVGGDIHLGPLSIAGSGREIYLKRASFDLATSTAGYANAAAFIGWHISDTIAGASFIDASTSGATALATTTWDAGAEKWAALVEVAKSVGAQLYCDANGTFVLADILDAATALPVWDISTGEHGVMVSADMELTSDDVFNRVVASGENTEDDKAPVSASATITSGPLRYGGPFGKVTKTYSSSLITNTTQAQTAANAMLRKYRAPNRTVTLSTVPNPALEAGDCLRVNYGPGIAPELHLAQSFTVPLAVDNASFTIDTIGGRDDE